MVQKSTKQLISEMISERLRIALDSEKESTEDTLTTGEEVSEVIEPTNDVVTTEEELQGFRIVQAILVQQIDVDRITHRDMKSYFSILLDDNNRKPICRLHFNRTQKYVGVFDEDKNEERIPIEKVEEIYKYGDRLLSTVKAYDGD